MLDPTSCSGTDGKKQQNERLMGASSVKTQKSIFLSLMLTHRSLGALKKKKRKNLNDLNYHKNGFLSCSGEEG